MEENILTEEKNILGTSKSGAGERGGKDSLSRGETNMRKIIRRAKSWWLFFAVLLIWIGAVQYFAAEKYQAVVKVVGENRETSVNTVADGLDFGSLAEGNSSTRFVTVKNNGKYGVYVKVYKLGEIGKFIKINRNDFVLGAGESKNIEFLLEVPSGAKEKEYEGKVLIFKIPKIL
ncbi:MAG: hypothetical protein WCQ96_04570 [Patescibacteria group bacterium]